MTVVPINKRGRCRVHIEPVEKIEGEILAVWFDPDGMRVIVERSASFGRRSGVRQA